MARNQGGAAEKKAAPNKHQQKTEATKRKLLKSALRVFSRDGFEAARIEDIAADAGHSRGAFYAHFQTKEDLFFALLEEQAQQRVEELRSELGGCATEAEKLDVLRGFYARLARNRQFPILILEFKLYALRHPKLRAKLAEAHRSIRQKIKWDAAESLWPDRLRCAPAESHVRKLMMHVALNGLVIERAYDPTSLSQETLERELQKLFDFVMAS